MFIHNLTYGCEIIFNVELHALQSNRRFCFKWRPVLQVLALEMVQLPPADGELHTPHAVPSCFEGFKALSVCFTKLRAGLHYK